MQNLKPAETVEQPTPQNWQTYPVSDFSDDIGVGIRGSPETQPRLGRVDRDKGPLICHLIGGFFQFFFLGIIAAQNAGLHVIQGEQWVGVDLTAW